MDGRVDGEGRGGDGVFGGDRGSWRMAVCGRTWRAPGHGPRYGIGRGDPRSGTRQANCRAAAGTRTPAPPERPTMPVTLGGAARRPKMQQVRLLQGLPEGKEGGMGWDGAHARFGRLMAEQPAHRRASGARGERRQSGQPPQVGSSCRRPPSACSGTSHGLLRSCRGRCHAERGLTAQPVVVGPQAAMPRRRGASNKLAGGGGRQGAMSGLRVCE